MHIFNISKKQTYSSATLLFVCVEKAIFILVMPSYFRITKAVAMDCEFVGVGPGAQENMLARVSLVNRFGHCIYDEFVKPTELVKDYRTHVSGVRPKDLKLKGVVFENS